MTAGVIDCQSEPRPESSDPRRDDAGKKVKGRKRHIVTDTAGHLVGLIVHIASIRLAKDFETTVESSTAWTLLAHIRGLTRTLAKA